MKNKEDIIFAIYELGVFIGFITLLVSAVVAGGMILQFIGNF